MIFHPCVSVGVKLIPRKISNRHGFIVRFEHSNKRKEKMKTQKISRFNRTAIERKFPRKNTRYITKVCTIRKNNVYNQRPLGNLSSV
jgi:hypothetical protein